MSNVTNAETSRVNSNAANQIGAQNTMMSKGMDMMKMSAHHLL